VVYIKGLAKVIKEGEFKRRDPMDLAHGTVLDIFEGTQRMERRR
jgi:hypothetical protein